jgi:hypothetical protein
VSIVDSAVPGSSTLARATISGTPSALGTFATAILASNSLGTQLATYVFSVTQPLQIATTSLPDAVVGTPYSQQLTATGGDGSFTWTNLGLPKGFALSPTGLLTGTPTVAGAFNAVVRVASTPDVTPVSATFPLTVHEAPVFGSKSPISATLYEGRLRPPR